MSRPNVLFIIADQHRWDFMGYESNGVTHTPNLDRLARAGSLSRSAYCNAPLCTPSRMAIASGRYGVNSGCFTNLHELPPDTPTFVEQFRSSGYRTCAIGKTHMEIHAYDSDLRSYRHREFMNDLGWDEICEISGNGMLRNGIRCAYSEFLRESGKFDEVLRFYEQWHYFMDERRRGDPNFVPHEFRLAEEFHETGFVGDRAVEWLRNRDSSQPFLLHVGFAGPHSPIEPFPTYMDLYRDAPETEPWGVVEYPERLPDGRRGYRAMISQIDAHVGRICDVLAERGELENTIVVYTADHGDMAGDRGRDGKTCFFEGSVHVPLIVSGPGVAPEQDSRALVELVDLGSTLCDLCGVAPHSLDQGKSLIPVLSGENEIHRETVYAEMGCDRMLFDGRYKLMWGDPQSDRRKLGRLHLDKPVDIPPSPGRLYDLQEDPHEECDLVQDDPALRTEMLEKLIARINENVQPQVNKSRGAYRPLRSE
ncbi:MAG: sulfatase-like hydrolase/transferase [Gemmatimonadetes bacterium]|jgi:arylsulfatase|nr:sulfatase-like hydrolase/transferase [Gemmatimonadota bacterium]